MTRPRLALQAGLAAAAGLALLAVVAAGRATSYASSSDAARVADMLAGLSLLAAGALAWQQRPGRTISAAAILAGAAWSAQDWIGWDGLPALRTAGALLTPLLVPLILLLLRAPRRLVAGLCGGVALSALGLALFRDPFRDVGCWSNCTDDVLLVRHVPALAGILTPAGAWLAVAGGCAVAVLAGLRLRGRLRWAAIAVGAAECAYGLERALATEDPHRTVFAATFLARAAALTALALAVAGTVLTARRSRLALARLGRELAADPPGGLQALLARTLADPELEVGYWVPSRGGYVGVDGAAVAPVSGRASTTVVREGRPVALIVHDRRLLDDLQLGRDIGAAVTLAADNERLRAELSAHLDDLRHARARIVVAADDRRRRLERDLHDSAQQRLLAVGYDLRLAQAAARSAGDDQAEAALGAAGADVAAVLEALRVLARGIFPAILDESGLGPALETLAELAPLPTEIRAVPEGRLPAPVELAMYLVVQSAIQSASAAGASHTVVAIGCDGEVVSGEVSSDARLDVPVALLDRLGALGGRAWTAGSSIRAEVPCA